MSTTPPAGRPRRRLRFSLRLLLLATALVAVWLGIALEGARRQQTAVAHFIGLGGDVQYESDDTLPTWKASLLGPLSQDFFRRVASVELIDVPVVDADMEMATWIRDLPHLTICTTEEDGLTDKGVAQLGRLRSLRKLSVFGAALSDEGLTVLRGLNRLEVLEIFSTREDCTGSFLGHVCGLKRLRHLSVGGPGFDDEGIAHLAALPALDHLRLDGAINDGALTHLVDLPLQKLVVWSDLLTDGAVQHLRRIDGLERLQLYKTQITAHGTERLSQMRNLKLLTGLDRTSHWIEPSSPTKP